MGIIGSHSIGLNFKTAKMITLEFWFQNSYCLDSVGSITRNNLEIMENLWSLGLLIVI